MVAIALIGGCERPRTELVVRVDSEIAWGLGRTVQSVVLTVRRGGATGPFRSARTTALGQGRAQLPMLVGVIESLDDTDTPVWIEALGCGDPNGCTAETAVVAQRAVVRFVAGQTLEVPLLLASACAGVTCASDQRCATSSGQCEVATRAQETVRPFEDNLDPAAVDAGEAGMSPEVGTRADSELEDAGAVDITLIDVGAEGDGPADGGSVDGRMSDGGPMDQEPLDAVMLDLGPTDAGPADSGPMDHGAVDTAPRDTGPVDTGPVDTGPVDTGPTVPTITCSTLVGSRTCRGMDGLVPCCITLGPTLPPACGTQAPIFGCLPN